MRSLVQLSKRPALLAFVGPLAAAALMIPLRTHAQPSSLALVMVVVVVASLIPGVRGAAIVAGLSAGIWFDFFLTRPYESFSIHRSSDVQTTLLLVAVAIAVGEVAARRRSARREGDVARQEMLSLYVVSQMLSAGNNASSVVEAVAGQIHELLFLNDCVYESYVGDDFRPYINRAGDLEYGHFDWPLQSEGLPNKDVLLPVDFQGLRLGHYVLRGPKLGVPLSHDRRLAAVALSDLAGTALGTATTNHH